MDQKSAQQNSSSWLETAAMTGPITLQGPDSRWDLVAALHPRLKSHISISRHLYRGEISYLLEDSITRQRYRFSQAAYEVVGRMTGKYSCEEIYRYLQEKEGKQAPEKDTIVEIIVQLATMEALTGNLPKDLLGQAPTKRDEKKNNLFDQVKKSPLFLRFPLCNPSSILHRYYRFFTPLYSKVFLTLLGILFVSAAVQLFLIWPDLSHNAIDRIFTQHNLLILWILYPIVKLIHEFAHAFSVKYYGGEVTEMGFMLLLFVPVPYVNASDSAGFPDKWQRITVAASGILAELTLASLALFVWSSVEPGLVRTICFNTILICGFSTLVFNGNPLVRFDGYFILSDLLEIPNLAARSGSFIWYHGIRICTGIETGKPSHSTASEKRWFLSYWLASFFYRLTIYGSIFYLFAHNFGPLGAVLGVVAIAQILLLPFIKRVQPLLRSTAFLLKRKKIVSSLFFFAATAVLAICLIPLPYTTMSEGIVWQSEEGLVKMKTSGIITTIIATPGKPVKRGDVLIECEDIELHHEILLLQSQEKELRQKKAAAFAKDPFEARMINEKLTALTERLHHKLKLEKDLLITSPSSGNFTLRSPKELTGRFFKQGEPIAFIQRPATTIRTLISQENIDPILEHIAGIDISVVSEPGKIFTGTIVSRNPQSTFQLPGKALGTAGGGKILINPEDSSQMSTLEKMFQLDIVLDEPLENSFPESRAYIKFQHGFQPLLFRWTRSLQQLFINEFRG